MSNFYPTKSIDNINLSVDILNNIDNISEVQTKWKPMGDIIINLNMNITDYTKLKNIGSIKYDVTFFDWVGFNEEFKQLFDLLKIHTTLCKKEISNALRYDICCKKVTYTNIIFEYTISSTFLVEDIIT